jgi:hypothetical protein
MDRCRDLRHRDGGRAAARRIRELEGYPASGVFLEFHVDTVFDTDEEAREWLRSVTRFSRARLRPSRALSGTCGLVQVPN